MIGAYETKYNVLYNRVITNGKCTKKCGYHNLKYWQNPCYSCKHNVKNSAAYKYLSI